MIKGLIFDLDGVLVDTKEIHFIALNEALKKSNSKDIISYNDHVNIYDGLPTEEKIKILNEKKILKKSKNKIVKKYKKIDALINLACINDPVENKKKITPFENFNSETFKLNVEKNIMMTFLPSKIFGNEMKKQKNGSIINFSSTYGIVAPDQNIYKIDGKRFFIKDASYPTAKFAIIGLSKYLASYWSEKNVRVNVVVPGGVENNQNKSFIKNYANKTILKRMAKKSDFNGTVHLLISELSDYITGAIFSVDGGYTAW